MSQFPHKDIITHMTIIITVDISLYKYVHGYSSWIYEHISHDNIILHVSSSGKIQTLTHKTQLRFTVTGW